MQQTMDVKVENKNYLEKEFNLLQTANNDIFEFIQEALLDGIWYFDIENRGNQWFSPKLWSTLGYRSVEVKYSIEDWNSIIHPEDLQLLIAKIEKNLRKPKKTLNLTIRFFHKDGSIVWFNCFGKLLPTESDNPNRLVIVLKNVTDLKLLENKFLKIEETFVEMNKVAKIGHWELDVIENEIFWSDYCKVIHDVSNDYIPDIYTGISFFEEGESRDRVTRLLENCLKNGTPWDEEFQIVTDIKSKWVRVIGNAIFEEGECKKIFGVIQDISKQKAQSFALTISQNQFKQIFDHAKVGMCMLDFEGNFLEVNKSMCQILGYTREEFLKLKDSSITHPKYVEFCEQKIEELISGAIDSYQMEKSYFHKNGQPVCVTISAPVVRNSKNEPQFIIQEVQDITERKNSEKNLRDSETKFRNIVENANDIIFISNLSGEFIYLSPNLEEKLGYNQEDLIGNSFLKIVHPNYFEFTIGALQKIVITKEKHLSDDFIILHKNGKKLWYQANGTPLFDENNEVYAVLGIGRDITDFKLSEEALLKSIAEVRLTAKRYKSLLDNDSVYIIKIDLNGNYSFVNNYFCSHFGFDQSVIGTSSLQGIIEEDHVLCMDTVTKCFIEPEVSHQVVLRKIMTDKAIGGSKWEFKGILDEDGQVKEILCVGIDITNEVRSLERAENLLTLTGKQNVQLKSFNYIVSHDIRSHAANIKALIELIPSIIDDEEKETVFEMLNLSSKKLSETLENLNQIISINKNTLNHYTEVKLLDEINNTLEIFSYQIKESDVVFLLNIDENLTLNLVKAYLDSILLNIISNAIKYQSINRNLIVTITASKTAKGTEVKISDNGRGFDFEKFKSKVFGMYKTFHSGEDSRGFGLYITKSQIEIMGGTISVESEIEIGTTFTLNFSSQ